MNTKIEAPLYRAKKIVNDEYVEGYFYLAVERI